MSKLRASYLAKRYGDLLMPSSRTERRKIEIARRVGAVMQAAGEVAPPVNLRKLAKHLQVAEVREAPLALNGRLIQEKGLIALEVNSGLPSDFQKRRVIAHELAHLILDTERLEAAYLGRDVRKTEPAYQYAQMEEACDLGADEILVPSQWLAERIGRGSASLDTLARLAEETACELRYLSKRLLEGQYWPGSHCIWWQREVDCFRVVDAVPDEDEYSMSSYRSLPLSSFPGRVLRENRLLYGSLQVKNDFVDRKYQAQGMPLSEDLVLTLI